MFRVHPETEYLIIVSTLNQSGFPITNNTNFEKEYPLLVSTLNLSIFRITVLYWTWKSYNTDSHEPKYLILVSILKLIILLYVPSPWTWVWIHNFIESYYNFNVIFPLIKPLSHWEGYCSLPLHNLLWIWLSRKGAIFITCPTFF
jgi:hypothetical protein